MDDSPDQDVFLVRVRAQVMMRDDSTGGWVPLGGGGLSTVAVRKRHLVDNTNCGGVCQYEYLIVGRRISDDHDVLSCTIKRDFQYNRVMPTFHHWKTGNKKFGLTFQTAADARTFDKGITNAIEDLLDGDPEGVTECTPLQINMDVGEGEVFMMLDLPLERESSQPSTPHTRSPPPGSTSRAGSPLVAGDPRLLSPTLSSPLHQGDTPLLNQLDTQRLSMLTRSATVGGGSHRAGRGSTQRGSGLPPGDPPPPGDNIYEWLHAPAHSPPLLYASTVGGAELRTTTSALSVANSDKYYVISPGMDKDSFSDTYVRFDIKDPQYHYPNLDSLSNVLPVPSKQPRRSSISSLKRHAGGLEDAFPFPQGKEKGKGKKGKRGKKGGTLRAQQERCAHCQDLYTERDNKRGSCSYSPDPVRQGIDCISCLACAKCLLYHCHYEDENFSEEEICTCTDTDGHLVKRWLGLSLLAVLVPCLCLYPVLTACYTCGRACHATGGKHSPVS